MHLKDFVTSYTIIELLCFLAAVICLSKDRSRIWKYFSFYLLLTCITEFLAIYLKIKHHSNAWLYDILMLAEVSFTSLMFVKLFSNNKLGKKLATVGLIVFIITYVIESLIHLQKTHKTGFIYFNDTANEIMSVFFVIYALYYFYLLLKDDHYVDLKFSASFWWVIGVLFFYFGTTAINLYRGLDITNNIKKPTANAVKKIESNLITHTDSSRLIQTDNQKRIKQPQLTKQEQTIPKQQSTKDTTKQTLTEYILDLLILVLYSCWIYSFICKKWLTTSVS